MMDLVTFMANSTGHEVRQPNMRRIFDTYYDALIDTVATKWQKTPEQLPDYYS